MARTSDHVDMVILAAVCASAAMAGAATVDVRHMSYQGWRDCIRLSNRAAELIVVPAVGRIMRFAPEGGPNMLWENPALIGSLADPAAQRTDWANFGGDKLWPAPQARWGWPPDPWLDGSPWTGRIHSDRSVELLSPISPALGLRFRRLITLHATDASATIRNELINCGRETFEWSVWQVTQVAEPDWIDFPLNRTGVFPHGYRVFPDTPVPEQSVSITGRRVVATRHAAQAYKIGADPRITEIRAARSGWTFTITGPARIRGSYPDEGCSVEVFSSPDPLPYMEMEVLGPIRRIEPERRTALTVRWRLNRTHAR